MKTTSKFPAFIFTLVIAIILNIGAVQAAAITGNIGVGTWNTQAEFADVKVVQGTATLYQSDFATGMTGWATNGGTWAIGNGYLRQTGSGSPAMAWVGDSTWSDYILTLKARKISGDEGFLITFGAPGNVSYNWWNIGGWGNTKHALQIPGMASSDMAGSIQTGVWYDITVQLSGTNVRCYLNGALVHDTARMLDSADRTDRFNQLINSPGFALLNGIEQEALRNLAGRDVYIGNAARATFDAMPSSLTYAGLSAAQQAVIIRKVNRNRLTWVRGYGYGSDTWRDDTITASVDAAVLLHNQLGVFDKHLTANNDPGVPTADANYDGWMRFGTQLTTRTALHEIAHSLGGGTHWRWSSLMYDGVWHGQYGNEQLAAFDGAGAVIHGDTQHTWPYGLNQESEYSDENARRHVLILAAMRRDMLVADQVNFAYASDIPTGTYILRPRFAPNSALDVLDTGAANGAPLGINAYNESNSQKFLLDLQADGTYRIRTALSGNRAVELPGGNTDNGSRVQLWDDNGLAPQRWFLIPTDNGYYKIAPLNNNFKGMDVNGMSNADGTAVQSWDYLDNFAQQWDLVPSTEFYTTKVASSIYNLTPRHATGKSLDVLNADPNNSASLGIKTTTSAANQKFVLDLQSDGTYRIRTALTGHRAVEMPGGVTTNGTKIKLWDDNGNDSQRWYLIQTDGGWYKIAPKNSITKSVDVEGASTAEGALINSWDYLAGLNQQWKLTGFSEAFVELGASTYSVSEDGGQATITVNRIGDLSIPASVSYTTSNGTATLAKDYTTTSGTLTFAAGETSKTITVPILNDTLDETDETLNFTLSNPQGGAILRDNTSAIISIADNDDPPSLSLANVSVSEGNSGTKNATFTLTLSAPSGQVVSVNAVTANGTATAGSDYTALASTTLNLAAGTTTKTFNIVITGDTTVEPDETFLVKLSSPVNATLSTTQATGTITNDDSASATPTVVSQSVSTLEDTGLIITLSVSDPDSTYTVKLTSLPANGTLYDGSSATAPVISAVPYTLTGTGTSKDKLFFKPTANANGATNFNFQASDGTNTSGSATVSVTVTAVNDVPSFTKGANQSVLSSAGTQSVAGWATALSAGPANEAAQSLDFLVTNNNNAIFTTQPAVASNGTLGFTPKSRTSGSATVSVKIHDNGGVQNGGVDSSAIQTFTITVKAKALLLTQTSPLPDQKMLVPTFKTGSITGVAESDSDVTKVEMTLSRLRSGVVQIWNGTAWGTTSARIPATLSGSGTSVNWTINNLFPPQDLLDAGEYIIVMNTTDTAGNTAKVTSRVTLSYSDSEVPVTLVFTPTQNQKVLLSDFTSGAANILSGNATDNLGVNYVRVKLSRKRGTSNYFWNGTAFTTSPVLLNATVSPVGSSNPKWNLDSQMPPLSALDSGLYQLEAYAIDIAGNKSATVVRPFTLGTDFTAPSVAIVAPTQGQKMSLNNFVAGTINGTAGDNLGVASVKIKLMRKSGTTNLYWNGTAFTATAATVDATVSPIGGTAVTWSLNNVPTPATGWVTGAYTLYASSYDEAGNMRTSASRGFILSAASTGATSAILSSSPPDVVKSAGSS